jgi:hypothetical protein
MRMSNPISIIFALENSPSEWYGYGYGPLTSYSYLPNRKPPGAEFVRNPLELSAGIYELTSVDGKNVYYFSKEANAGASVPLNDVKREMLRNPDNRVMEWGVPKYLIVQSSRC